MAKYLTKFTDQAAWEAGEKQYPNVSLLDDGTVLYTTVTPPYSGLVRLEYENGSIVEMPASGSTIIQKNTIQNKAALVKADIGLYATEFGTRFAGGAFSGCTKLINVRIPNTITSLGERTFFGCISLQKIKIPDSITDFGSLAFYQCSGLTNINIPSGTTNLGTSTFGSCTALTSVIIPDSVTSWNGAVFQNCYSLESINIPNKITTIPLQCFMNCSGLTSVNIPSGLTSISSNAFNGCSSLTSIDLSNCSGLTIIDNYAFMNCTGLTSFTITTPTPPTLGNLAFDNTNDCAIFVPAESVSAYRQAPNWSNYASRIQAIQ